MIDKSRDPAAPRDPLPPFLPVPRQCKRHDGWTPERQHGFIEALADTGSVKSAAHAVNMTPESAYLLRRHPEADSFRKAWENALKLGVRRLEDIAMERALHGVEVPVYSYGKLIGTRRVYNDRLLMFILRNRAGKRFQADGRRKPEAQREEKRWIRNVPDPDEVRASILRKIEAIKAQREAEQSPRTRRLKEAYRRAAELDRQHRKEEHEAETQRMVARIRGESDPGEA